MDEDYISISTLNDFIFCPYSIYLHNVYMESDNSLFHAAPQTTGKIAHKTLDTKKASSSTTAQMTAHENTAEPAAVVTIEALLFRMNREWRIMISPDMMLLNHYAQ